MSQKKKIQKKDQHPVKQEQSPDQEKEKKLKDQKHQKQIDKKTENQRKGKVEYQHDKASYFAETVFKWIVDHKALMISALVIFLSAGILLSVYSYLRQSAEENSLRVYDTAVSYLNNLNYITNEQQRQSVYQQQVEQLNQMVFQYPETAAANRGRILLGRLFFENGLYGGDTNQVRQSFDYYQDAYKKAKKPFYKALAIIGKASCYEYLGEYGNAFDAYQTVLDEYSGQGFNVLALTGMARAKELTGDIDLAISFYQKIVDDYPESQWLRYAKGKIFYYSDQSE